MFKAEYRVLNGATANSLEEQVVDLMTDGFIPQGGVAVSVLEKQEKPNGGGYYTEWLYTQAMVKVRAVEQ